MLDQLENLQMTDIRTHIQLLALLADTDDSVEPYDTDRKPFAELHLLIKLAKICRINPRRHASAKTAIWLIQTTADVKQPLLGFFTDDRSG